MGEGLSDTTIRRSRPPATAKGCSTTPISRTPSHRVRTPQEANGRTNFVALLTKRGGAQATFVAFDLLRSAGIRDVDCGDNSTASVDAKRAAIQSQARFTQLSCAGDATRSEKPPAAHRGRGFRFRISPLLCAISVFAKISKGSPTRVAQREALAPLIASAEGILFSEALAAEGAVMCPKANWALRGSRRSDGVASIRAAKPQLGSRP